MNMKIRTILVTLIAAAGIASVGIAPVAAQAQGIDDLEKAGYTCEKAGEDFIVCTDKNGHEWWCNHEGCQQIKLQVVSTKLLHTTGVTVKAPPVVTTTPPVLTKATVTVTSLRLAA